MREDLRGAIRDRQSTDAISKIGYSGTKRRPFPKLPYPGRVDLNIFLRPSLRRQSMHLDNVVLLSLLAI